MAAIDLTPLTTVIQDQAKESLKLVDNLKSLRTQYLDRAAVLFGVASTADGNDVVSMWSGCLRSDKLIDAILLGQTDAELQVSWEIVVGVPVVTITADLTALSVALKDALSLIEANEALFLVPTLDRSTGALGYPTLTSGQRSAANSKFVAVSTLLVI